MTTPIHIPKLDIDQSREEANPPPKPLPVWSPEDFLAYKPDPGAFLLGDGLIERGELTSLVGIGGLGKSRIALWFCVCQIIRRKWCGLSTNGEPQRCLFLSTENGVRRWKTDLEKMLLPLTDEERDKVQIHLRVLALIPGEDCDMNLGKLEAVARLTETIRTEAPGLIVFDPFADMISGDENKTADLVTTLQTLRTVLRKAAPNAAGLIIHHARTGASNVAQAGDNFSAGNFGRGAKALYSSIRCELQLAPGDRDNDRKLVLACGKANNCEKFPPRGIVFNSESFSYDLDPDFNLDEWRDDVAGKRRNQSLTIAQVVNIVTDLCPLLGDEAKAGAIQDAVKETTGGASVRTVRDRLREAKKAGYLRDGERKGTYRLGSKPLPK
jgi:hypothetical protein